jgi:hypothetical protein
MFHGAHLLALSGIALVFACVVGLGCAVVRDAWNARRLDRRRMPR